MQKASFLFIIQQKNVKVEEKGSNYEATYSGVDDSSKEALKKMIISNQPDAEKVLKNMEIEKLDIKYVVDKKHILSNRI